MNKKRSEMFFRQPCIPTRTRQNGIAGHALVLLVLLVTTLVAGACSDAAVDPTATLTPTSMPAAMSTSTSEPAPVRAIDDPQELASFLIDRAKNNDWEAVQAWLVDDFQGFDDDTIQRAVGDRLIVPGAPELGDWDMEAQAAFTTVRLRDMPAVALVLRRDAEGVWRYDPGPHALYMANLWEQNPTLSELTGPISPMFERQLISDADPRQIVDHFVDSLESITIDRDVVTVTFDWMFRRGASGEVPLTGLRWTAGKFAGPAEVTWTTAMLTKDRVVFPFPPGFAEGVALRYMVTFQLEGVPDREELHLYIDGLTLADATLGELTLSIDYRLPSEEYPQPAS